MQTILILLTYRGIVNRIFNKSKLDEIATDSMMLVINENTIKLVNEISKTLTESGRKVVSNR